MVYLFEVSWEICNKVGGIHTVIRTKVPHALKEFGANYYVLGPLLNENPEFKEAESPEYGRVREALEQRGLRCKLGCWKVEGEPKAILVDFRDRYDVNKLLYGYWQDFGVDSYAGGWEYIEPILFSTACGEVIEALHHTLLREGDKAIAHLHDWLTGGAVLRLKEKLPEVATVFTTHSTVLGRAMANSGRDFYPELDSLNPFEEARTYGVSAKHSMESVCAREVDCLTTVSNITANEAESILHRVPNKVVQDGININDIPDYAKQRSAREQNRARVFEVAENFLQKRLPRETRFLFSSGRYEFHNKGYDLFLDGLAQLEKQLTDQDPPVVALLLVPGSHKGVVDSVYRRVCKHEAWEDGSVGLLTHRLLDEQNDPIVKTCYRLQLRNSASNRVNVIFCPAYLDGHDGIFDLSYDSVLSACDAGVFPCFYEPWGYTALECVALGIPAVTTDHAGFGRWAQQIVGEKQKGVFVLRRSERSRDEVVNDLAALLRYFTGCREEELRELAAGARQVAARADWTHFFKGYQAAYQEALETMGTRFDILDTSKYSEGTRSTFKGGRHHRETPLLRSFTVVATLPQNIAGLEEIAHNYWWSWNPDARELFSQIDPALWAASQQNPVLLLSQVPSEVIEAKARDKAFVKEYERILSAFRSYMNEDYHPLSDGTITKQHPVAYFSMEYGIHESLPIYSGGLGVLAGDHLKSASDLNLPLLAVGLLYRRGYFSQSIDRDGNQLVDYPLLDLSTLPIKTLLDEQGKESRVSVSIRGREVFARIWIAHVGRVKLYLMDTDIEENEIEDRQLSSQLYGGDRRTRVTHELLLGVGGVKLVRDVLKIEPSVYHLNEGHVAFLLLERIRQFMKRGLSFQEAREAVKASSVFTTHTPVPAGNESFEPELLDYYMRDYIEEMPITWEQFLELGSEVAGRRQSFSMTVLALKLTSKANAVSKLHRKVCQDMWQNVWKGINVEEIPISSITNGIHLQTWISRKMRHLLDQHIPISWGKNEDDPEVWKQVSKIPDATLWDLCLAQKKNMLERLKVKITEDYARRGEDPQLIRDTLRSLTPNKLIIGFAKRFATYKRANLILKDMERITRIVNDPERPVVVFIAGKAHPADGGGQAIIKSIVEATRSEQLRGKVIYLEGYDMGIARLLTRGVDIWLNTPIRPYEASGTSGMKAAPNGALNFSILDGWWDEAYNPGIGFAIDGGADFKNREHQDEIDNMSLLNVLEQEILPLYYDKDEKGVSTGWMKLLKNSIREVSGQFNTLRMVKEYYNLGYLPTAKRKELLYAGNFANIRKLTQWKQRIASRFTRVQILKVNINGITGDTMAAGGELEVDLYVDPGRLDPSEIRAEFVFGPRRGTGFAADPRIIRFEHIGPAEESDAMHFKLQHRVMESGNFIFAVRVIPVHELLASPEETGLMCWG